MRVLEKNKISVVMSVYNGGKYLKESINSILEQTYRNFEFIIINDGSVDNSKKIINEYNDSRIKYIENEKNMGLIYSLNKGIKVSTGKYVARMDSDDIAHPNRFEKQIEFLEKNLEIDICGTNINIFGENIKEHRIKVYKFNDEILTQMLFNSPICHPTVMMKGEILKKYNYNLEYKGVEDYKLWIDLSVDHKFSNIDIPLLNYRILETSITRQEEKQRKNRLEIHRKLAIEIFEKINVKYNDIYFLFQYPDSEKYLNLNIYTDPNENITFFLNNIENDFILKSENLNEKILKEFLGKNLIKYMYYNLKKIRLFNIINIQSLCLCFYGIKYFLKRRIF